MHSCILINCILISSLLAVYCVEEISVQALAKSIIHHGDTAMFDHLHAQLRAKKCIRVAFIGGSVTCGHGVLNGTAAYTAIFAENIGSAFPCHGDHNITVLCRSARATDYWIDQIVGRREMLAGYDLIVVDTALNDVRDLATRAGRGADDPDAFIRLHTEILISLLLQKSNRDNSNRAPAKCVAETNYTRLWTGAAVVYLGTSTRRTELWRGPLPRSTDAVHVQLPVAIMHGVPYISVIDGLGPFSSSASQHWLKTTWYSEPAKDVHPGPWAHRALARALLYFLTAQHLHREQLPWHETASLQYCPRSPAFVEKDVLDMYLDLSPLHIPTVYGRTTEQRMAYCEDWSIKSDVPGKPGLLSEVIGAQCSVWAFPSEVERHPVEAGEVHVLMLKSYEHMGRVRVTVKAVPAVPATDGSGNKTCVLNREGGDNGGGEGQENRSEDMGGESATVLGSRDIDCLWGERVSEARVEVVQIAMLPEGDFCLAFAFEVLESDRVENKVKILGITVL